MPSAHTCNEYSSLGTTMTLQEGFLPPCRHTACVQGKQIAPGIALSDSRWYTGTRMTQANLLQCSQSAPVVLGSDCAQWWLSWYTPGKSVSLPCLTSLLPTSASWDHLPEKRLCALVFVSRFASRKTQTKAMPLCSLLKGTSWVDVVSGMQDLASNPFLVWQSPTPGYWIDRWHVS